MRTQHNFEPREPALIARNHGAARSWTYARRGLLPCRAAAAARGEEEANPGGVCGEALARQLGRQGDAGAPPVAHAPPVGQRNGRRLRRAGGGLAAGRGFGVDDAGGRGPGRARRAAAQAPQRRAAAGATVRQLEKLLREAKKAKKEAELAPDDESVAAALADARKAKAKKELEASLLPAVISFAQRKQAGAQLLQDKQYAAAAAEYRGALSAMSSLLSKLPANESSPLLEQLTKLRRGMESELLQATQAAQAGPPLGSGGEGRLCFLASSNDIHQYSFL